jgi:hypothetical protein
MSNREMLIGFISSILGVFILAAVQKVNNHRAGIVYSYEDLREMKAECEKNLPRSTECSIVVYYQPAAELEKTE